MLKRTLAGLLVAVGIEGAAFAGPFEDAQAALSRGDYATALKLWEPLAEEGNALAQNSLGTMYAQGHGVPQDYGEAVRWFRKAAEQGNYAGQRNLGLSYFNGFGTPQDYTEAAKWLQLSADHGDAVAQLGLATMYFTGHGFPQDDVLAYVWFNLAAAQGNAMAAAGRDLLAKAMTANQIAEAQRLAREWRPTRK